MRREKRGRRVRRERREDPSNMEIIKFNKDIYNLKAIEKAIEEYKKMANFTVKEVDDYFEVSLDKIDQEFQGVIKNEFANYVSGINELKV